MFNLFIDGDQGTTGLRVRDRLAGREDISLLSLPEEKRKDLEARAAMARRADAPTRKRALRGCRERQARP